MNLLAFDPGKTTGWALYIAGKLALAGTVHPYERGGLWAALDYVETNSADLVVIEQPRWYPREREVDYNDVLDLAVLVGELKGYFGGDACRKIELVAPRTWKGSVPKPIHNRRVLAKLTAEELAVLPKRPRAKTLDSNMVDAIGIGLWRLGRV